jgi:hypothetical protein
MMKSKSLVVSTVFILVTAALDFFREEGFKGETFLFFRGSISSLGGVTSLCFRSSPFPFISSTSSSPPWSGDTKAVLPEAVMSPRPSPIVNIVYEMNCKYVFIG